MPPVAHFLSIITALLPAVSAYDDASIITDLKTISQHWGQISPYTDNPANLFGVQDVGLPRGCQIEQAHSLQRHAQRFPTSYFDDGSNDENFAGKIANFTGGEFTGPLGFLNSWRYIIGDSTGYLTGIGATTEFESGVSFWNRYGRILYGAGTGQLAYDTNSGNRTGKKPVLRTTSQSRMWNSEISWALGFFGTSFQVTPDPALENFTVPYDVVIIPEGGTENNTLAAYDSCVNDFDEVVGYLGDLDVETYIPRYLAGATKRLQQYVPTGFNLTVNDTYAMQSICAYENAYIGTSSFCDLFTLAEWQGFESTLDMEYYYGYSYGNPTGRAQGLGYLQELLARLQNQHITSSNSSVNSTLDNNESTFPLHEPFYADFSHDDIIISVLTAMSLDYLKDPPSLTDYPPNPNRTFILSQLTPFGARLITEVIGCSSADPAAQATSQVQYFPEQYGYNVANATHIFVRMRLNNGILPLSSIRGGACEGRTDGLCTLESFIQSQADAEKLANYDYVCFGNWTGTIKDPTSGKDYDGTIGVGNGSVVV